MNFIWPRKRTLAEQKRHFIDALPVQRLLPSIPREALALQSVSYVVYTDLDARPRPVGMQIA